MSNSAQSAQGTAMGFHTAVVVLMGLGLFYIVRNHFWLSLMAAGGYALHTQVPSMSRYIAGAALALGAPAIIVATWDHWLLVMTCIIVALVAYTYADDSVKQRLLDAADALYNPVSASVGASLARLQSVSSTAAAHMDAKIKAEAAKAGAEENQPLLQSIEQSVNSE